MKQLLTGSLSLLLVVLLSSCQSGPSSATPEVFQSTAVIMEPHFECANYFSLIKQTEGVTESLDEAASIGEGEGFSPGQIMQAYKIAKTAQEEQVTQRATEIASKREGLIPRISGEPPFPNEAEEQKAWNELYDEQCSSS